MMSSFTLQGVKTTLTSVTQLDSFGRLADCLDALVNKGFYLNLSLSVLFLSSPHPGQG